MNDDDDLLAAEFALGLLDPPESEAVLRRVQSDDILSLRVAWWRDQIGPLVAELETPPPERLWPRIAAQLPANDNLPRLVKLWRSLAVGATGVAAVLAVYIGSRQPTTVTVPVPVQVPVTRQPAPMVAILSGDKNPAVVTVSYDATSGQLTVAPNALDAGKGDAELWIIPEDGKPRSIGVIATKTPTGQAIVVDRRSFVHPGATFAISLEPKGGSPTDAPTGPVIATGKIVRV